jgi:KDO2-lipid IV(A) lauroyltransferase
LAQYSDRYWQKPRLRHYLEYIAAWPVYAVLSRMPVNLVSNILGTIGRNVGPRVSLSNRIRDNLRLVWPRISDSEIEKIVRGVCDNFARVNSDYWSLDQIRRDQDNRIEIVGAEHLVALRDTGKSGILLAGHLGNWEMVTLAARMHDLPLTVVYRPFNNPLIDAYVRDWQRGSGVELIMKGRDGARRLTQVLKGDGHTIMLVDVRMNDGVRIPFLGVEAMTPAAPAALALKYDALLVPVRVERTGPAHFRVTVEEPRSPVNTGDRNADIAATMSWVNERFGEWIRARPEQWMWFHRRWGKNPKQPGS